MRVEKVALNVLSDSAECIGLNLSLDYGFIIAVVFEGNAAVGRPVNSLAFKDAYEQKTSEKSHNATVKMS